MRPHLDRPRLDEGVARLTIPDPFDVAELTRGLGRARGRPIELRPMHTHTPGPSGMWISTRDVDYVCYEADTGKLHQEHIILHELGHLLCGHPPAPASPDELVRLLLPSIDPAVVRSVLGRTAYSDPQEYQAELFAMLVLERSGRLPPDRRYTLGPEMVEVLDRIESALTTPPR